MGISEIRREYSLTGMRRSDLEADPIAQFKKWFEQATGARSSGRVRSFFIRLYKSLLLASGTEPLDLTAMTLATADNLGRPSARVVLLKGVDQRGFIFYTNYDSRKGQQLAENPQAALVFYWPDQERQVCIAGAVTRLPAAESDAYFRTRPQGSRLAAWASRQSAPVKDRASLEAQWKQMEAKYAGQEIPRPPFWGGYLMSPNRVEFWQGRPNRLHDRFCYVLRQDKTWLIDRLSP